MTNTASLATSFANNPDLRGKLSINYSCSELGLSKETFGFPGDDAAVIPDQNGWQLIAMEGFMNEFVAAEPWFAGWCSVMVNLSDILAMGGRATAVTNAIWAPTRDFAGEIFRGMREASEVYQVPIVGGHTNLNTDRPQLSAAIFGKTKAVISSFNAQPGEDLIAATDLRGSYVGESKNFAAFLHAPSDRLRADNEILPRLAEDKLVTAGKDISQGGIVGTSLMLAECSKVGIEIDINSIKSPDEDLEKWMIAFPSFGFLLTAKPQKTSSVLEKFNSRDIDAKVIGKVVSGSSLSLLDGSIRHLVWNHSTSPYLGF
tara:strand:+ start:267 stop:1214 length:948 start_codon:yes stop_codon:yes gene_type:complete